MKIGNIIIEKAETGYWNGCNYLISLNGEEIHKTKEYKEHCMFYAELLAKLLVNGTNTRKPIKVTKNNSDLRIIKAAKDLFNNRLGWGSGGNLYAPRVLWAKLGEAIYGKGHPSVLELRELISEDIKYDGGLMDRRKINKRGMSKDRRIKERRSKKERRQVNSQIYGNRVGDIAINKAAFLKQDISSNVLEGEFIVND